MEETIGEVDEEYQGNAVDILTASDVEKMETQMEDPRPGEGRFRHGEQKSDDKPVGCCVLVESVPTLETYWAARGPFTQD